MAAAGTAIGQYKTEGFRLPNEHIPDYRGPFMHGDAGQHN
jgi:hypothetical protein